MSDDVSTPIPRGRRVEFASAWVVALVVPLLLLLPAFWNAYPLLQYDTGGYLARWYEGYLVPSRSTVFGLYLHFGEPSYFWIDLGVQALATLWILQLTLRLFGIRTPLRILVTCALLTLTTALPWLASMLLTDIFAGLAVLALFVLIVHGNEVSRLERGLLMLFTAFAAATHSATLGVLLGLCLAGLLARPLLGPRIPLAGLGRGFAALAASAVMLLAANFALSGQVAWTPGGVGVAFGRMLQDGIVARYLNDHCATLALKLCPYRDALPATADDFLWGKSMFNTLGRFQGMDDEMGFIALHALADYPLWQAEAALTATAQQLTHVATGEGTNGWIPHTYGIIERYLPGQVAAMRAARQQHWDIDFASINRVHVPVALGSMAMLIAILGHALWRRRLDDVSLLAATVCLALLGNAAICGVISGPHDRYGARMVWLASFVVLIAANRRFGDDQRPQSPSEEVIN
ncbi:hypothetical protein HNR60_004652 [Rhodopseudomonas rhenobacensis]|uniref:Transmembrane protein n=1 Tax=Rhodopseudomonas rhenobacensis TaxID=87461 RepID=A0A7W7Z8E1_9BRAD|nr:hypothetical protein [Rhodopseudomonas rhenobacensis]MBB5049868.1 hypothetical protein [Rhodopseudomonas rhenobacensis]